MTRHLRHSTPARRAGLTLIEILVSIAMIGILGGLVMAIYFSMTNAIRRTSEKTAVAAEARSIYEGLDELFRRNALAVVEGDKARARWRSDMCAFPIVSDQGGPGLWRVEIFQTEGEAGGLTVRREAIAGMGGSARDKEKLGAAPAEYSCRVEFQYATRLEGVNPVWRDALSPDERPKLVKAVLRVASLKEPDVALAFEAIFNL